jgi:hypothetical protein
LVGRGEGDLDSKLIAGKKLKKNKKQKEKKERERREKEGGGRSNCLKPVLTRDRKSSSCFLLKK